MISTRTSDQQVGTGTFGHRVEPFRAVKELWRGVRPAGACRFRIEERELEIGVALLSNQKRFLAVWLVDIFSCRCLPWKALR